MVTIKTNKMKKTDFNLCRLILKYIEDNGRSRGVKGLPSIDGYGEENVATHIGRLYNEGMLNHEIDFANDLSVYTYLTYKGRNFLNNGVGNETIWNEVLSLASMYNIELDLYKAEEIRRAVMTLILFSKN